MSKYREHLPQLDGQLFLTDGGLETTLVFHENIDLPGFAAITLMDNPAGMQLLKKYFERYLQIMKDYQTGFILESVTWRGDSKWAHALGYSLARYEQLNRLSIQMLEELRQTHETPQTPIVISGCLGPKGDAYNPQDALGEVEAQHYHAHQINILADAGADLITAMTLTSAAEAIGIVKACQQATIPVVISFTVETDGRLPDGSALKHAIERVDAASADGPVYYMINCAHPTHFMDTLIQGEGWQSRLRSIRANASCLSHAELDEAEVLDSGNPDQLGQDYVQLKKLLPQLNVVGGCCGTDHRHIESIARCLTNNKYS